MAGSIFHISIIANRQTLLGKCLAAQIAHYAKWAVQVFPQNYHIFFPSY